jgi:hypothetical protein
MDDIQPAPSRPLSRPSDTLSPAPSGGEGWGEGARDSSMSETSQYHSVISEIVGLTSGQTFLKC